MVSHVQSCGLNGEIRIGRLENTNAVISKLDAFKLRERRLDFRPASVAQKEKESYLMPDMEAFSARTRVKLELEGALAWNIRCPN